MGVKCFLVTDAGRTRLSLRRYVSGDHNCPKGGYHNANGPVIAVIDDAAFRSAEGRIQCWEIEKQYKPANEDPRWPSKCDGCDYQFTPADSFQLFNNSIWVDGHGGEHSLRDATPGMMWDAHWSDDSRKGPDGKSLVVVCPNGVQWHIDGPCSNCTQKDDRGPFGVAHRCWTRTGTPPLIQVGKQFGKTCAAGGGSIQAGDYHGFLGISGAQPGYFT